MDVACLPRRDLVKTLRDLKPSSLRFIVLITGALPDGVVAECLDASIRVLEDRGVLFVQGTPDRLSEIGVALDRTLDFKYWIAVESSIRNQPTGLPNVHAGILAFQKGRGAFNVRRVRFPHSVCVACGRSLRDWGGKSHLMHPDGCLISDVWTELPSANNYTCISRPVLETILRMVDWPGEDIRGLVAPKEALAPGQLPEIPAIHDAGEDKPHVNELAEDLVNVVHEGDALEILKRYPDNCIDLAFADPPYNLHKGYNTYDDGWDESEYIEWCNAWLAEYARVLKPNGSLYVLNLPRWTMYHAVSLNRMLFFQNWIVWDSLSEPRGKLLPAHYGLLFYTKHPAQFTFNYSDVGTLDARYYCRRPSCIARREMLGLDDIEPLTDVWWDIHRLRHRRDRDRHPCQLPESLLERIVRLSSNEGDIVLDALCGAGTALVVAARLGRRYVGIDIDSDYVAVTRDKLANVERQGCVTRCPTRKAQLPYTKKELQLELRELATRLGRLPTPDDVERLSKYDLAVFWQVFPTWGKALKAARLEPTIDARPYRRLG